MVEINGISTNGSHARVGTDTVKQGLAQMLKGGVIVSQSTKSDGRASSHER
jgi:pyridoxal biosynthesis lyase PdxS